MKKRLSALWVLGLVTLLMTSCTPTETEIVNCDDELYYKEEIILEESTPETFEPSDEVLPEPVEINADFEVEAVSDGSFIITTNLPSETELSLTLNGRGYLAQGKAFVKDGIAISEPFTNKGKPLYGDYKLEVLMPIPNVQTDYVKHFIGENGEYLTGPNLKGALGTVVVSKEFKVSFPVDEIDKSAVTNDIPSDTVYYRSPTGKRYHTDPECCGENSYVANDISDLSPCKVCVGKILTT